jgi:CHAT domain-containing protein
MIMDGLHAQSDRTISIRAAMFWIMAFSATQGAVLNETPEQPELTTFGVALLNDVVMGTLGVNRDETPHMAMSSAPTDDDLQRLDFELWGQATSDDPRGFHAYLLACLTRGAIVLAPAQLIDARESLAATALLLAEILPDIADPDEQTPFAAKVQALLESAATCIPPDQFVFARRQAALTYFRLQQERALQSEPDEEEMTAEGFVETILVTDSSAVPRLLAQHLSFIIEHDDLHRQLLDYCPEFYQQALHHERPSDPATVAVYWLEACVVTDGAFWEADTNEPILTPFGAAILACISLAGSAAFDLRLSLPAGITPTEAELERLNGVICRQMDGKARTLAAFYVLSRTLRAALVATDRADGKQLTETAEALAERLLTLSAQRGTVAEVQADLRREASTLRQAVGEFEQARVDDAARDVDDMRASVAESASPDPEFVQRLLNQAQELADEDRYAEALVPLREAIPLLQVLAQDDRTYLHKLAGAFLMIAVSLQPFAVFEQLSELDGPDQLREVFRRLPTDQLEESLGAAQQSLAHYHTLAIDDAAKYASKQAFSLSIIGAIQLVLRRDEHAAIAALEQAIALLEACPQDDPPVAAMLNQARYFRIMADQVPFIWAMIGEGQEEMEALLEDDRLLSSINSLRPLAARDPSMQPRLAEALALHGAALGQEGRYDEALQALLEASDIYRHLADETQAYLAPFVRAYALLGETLSTLERQEEAVEVVRDVIARCRQWAEIDQLNREDRASIVLALGTAGKVLDIAGAHEGALEAVSDAVALARQLIAEDERYQTYLAQTLLTLGAVLHSLERETEMLRVFEEADDRGIPIFSEWLPNKRPRWEHLARLFLSLGDPKYLERAIEAAAEKEEPIQRVLALLEHEQPDVTERIKAAWSLIGELGRSERIGEALTLELVIRSLSTKLMQVIDEWSPGKRGGLLELVEENANTMVQICEILHDEPCRAHFLFYRSAALSLSLQGGTHQALQGMTSQAIKDIEQAANIYRSLVKRDPAYRGAMVTVLNNLGLAYSSLNDVARVEEGTVVLEEAVALSRALAHEYPAVQEQLVMTLNNLGLAYSSLGYAGASVYVEELLSEHQFERAFVKASPRMGVLKAFQTLGEALNLTGELLEQEPWAAVMRAEILVNMAAVAGFLGDDQATALTLSDEALARYRALAGGVEFLQTQLAELGIRLWFLRGGLLQQGDAARDSLSLSASYDALKEAVTLVEQYLIDLPWHDDQLRFLGNEDMLYKQIVRTCLLAAEAAEIEDERHAWHEKAWQHADHARARLTLQTLIQAAADAQEAPSPRTQAFQTYAGHVHTFQTVRSHLSKAEKQEQLDKLGRERKRLRRDMADSEILSTIDEPNLDAVQQQIRMIADGALLVEFFLLHDCLVAFLLDGKTLGVEQLGITANELHTLTRSFRQFDTDIPNNDRLEPALAELGTQLMNALAPSLAALPMPPSDAPDRVPHVFLLPAGDLHFWPLHALHIDASTRLLDRYAVSLLPTATALPILAKQETHPGPYYGFAPPTNLEYALPQIYAEAAILGDTVTAGTILRTGVEATFDALRAVHGGILSFATHTQVDLAAPERSAIQFAAPNGSAEPLEWITALEFLVGLNQPHCELLLLWGCQTHGEGAQAGDNWLGISRAFLRAGRSLVSSLWSVSDAATLAISVEFMRGLTQDLTVPQALRQAVRAIRQADFNRIEEWGHVIETTLPSAKERGSFSSAWERTMLEVRLRDPKRAPFAELGTWAPYVTIGWPNKFRRDMRGTA